MSVAESGISQGVGTIGEELLATTSGAAGGRSDEQGEDLPVGGIGSPGILSRLR